MVYLPSLDHLATEDARRFWSDIFDAVRAEDAYVGTDLRTALQAACESHLIRLEATPDHPIFQNYDDEALKELFDAFLGEAVIDEYDDFADREIQPNISHPVDAAIFIGLFSMIDFGRLEEEYEEMAGVELNGELTDELTDEEEEEILLDETDGLEDDE